jgi:hypothetical protein
MVVGVGGGFMNIFLEYLARRQKRIQAKQQL